MSPFAAPPDDTRSPTPLPCHARIARRPPRRNRPGGAPSGHRARRLPEAGYGMLEMMIASLVSLLVVGGVLMLLTGMQDLQRDQQQLIDAQQTARLGLVHLRRDVQLAGVGLGSMLSPLPVLMPRADGGVTIRYNADNVTAALVADMSGPTSALRVDTVAGFQPGVQVAIFDAGGALDIVTLTSVKTSPNQLVHTGASKAYTVADATVVARIQTIDYSLMAVNDNFALMRQEDNGAAQAVALNVRSLNITYYDDSVPPQPFVPVIIADQLRIQMLELALEIETEDVRLNTTEKRTVTLVTRVVPRAIALS